MKTIAKLINKNVYYLGSNYEYFKYISRFLAYQRCKSIFISNKKEAITSIDRELGNMRATSYAYHVLFENHSNYIKTIHRILKTRETPDILLISFKAGFEQIVDSDRNPLLEPTEEEVDLMVNFYIPNLIKTITMFLDIFKKQGKGIIASLVTDSSSNPLERIMAQYINTYLLALDDELRKESYSGILCKVFEKRSENIPYDRFAYKLASHLTGKRRVVRL